MLPTTSSVPGGKITHAPPTTARYLYWVFKQLMSEKP